MQPAGPLATIQASLVIAVVVVGAFALPAGASEEIPDPDACVYIYPSGPGVAIDPKCIPVTHDPGEPAQGASDGGAMGLLEVL